MEDNKHLSGIEKIKTSSDHLRGEITESLKDEITGAIREGDQALIKFHGMYQQDNRDRREERAAKKLDRLYSFMIRLRLPGGLISAPQWIAMHHIAGEKSTGVIKITTRQTVQLHGIVKSSIKPTIASFNAAMLDSIATCGDINRNITCTAHPGQSPLHAEIFGYADAISTMLMPKTKAYYEIWLDQEKLVDKKEEADPLYQDRYLPRKFKIGIVIPPNNDIDVLTNDLGLIAITENNELTGFNVAIGGGMSTTHGNAATYARLGTVIGFVPKGDDIMKVIYEIVTVQRDYGNRSDRKLARLKYTVDKVGADWYKTEVEKRSGITIAPAKPYSFTGRHDNYGWAKNHEGKWYYTAYVASGRITDDEDQAIKSALFEVAETGLASFRFSGNQNVIVSDVAEKDKASITAILDKYNVTGYTQSASPLRKNALACVALPTCPLALAEGQRYMPVLLSKIEPLLARYGLEKEPIIMRMTGCPNGCARPGAAEISLVGTAPGRYNLHLGGDRAGTRLNTIYREHLDEQEILGTLDKLFAGYKVDREAAETFGDYALRKHVATV